MILRTPIFPSTGMKYAVKTLLGGYAQQRICAHFLRSIVTVNDSEVLSRFIDTLMTSKMNKWRSKNEASCEMSMETSRSNDVAITENISEISSSSVDDYVYKHLKSPHLDTILNVCLGKELTPSTETLMKAAYSLAKTGNTSGIETIISLADIGYSCDEQKKEEFKVFQAEAMWRAGGSVQKSLDVLYEVYQKYPGLRRAVRSSLRSLIGEVMRHRSEASLVMVMNLVLKLASPHFGDAIPLVWLWTHGILSNLFADQQMAEKLVTLCKDNLQFRRVLQNRLHVIVGQALARHHVEAIYRVLEALFRLSMYKAAEVVLGKLFDYKYITGDKNGCEAILELCSVTNLDIGSTRRKQFDKAAERWTNRRYLLAACKSAEKLQGGTELLPVPKFKLKL